MVTREEEPLLASFGLAMGVLAAELAAAFFSYGFPVALLLHGVIVGALALKVRGRWGQERLTALLLLLTAIAGPFGAMICLMAIPAYARCARRAVPASEWIETFFDYGDCKESEDAYERVAARLSALPAGAVEPFQDILAGGTVAQKQMVIAKVTRYFRPQFASLLLQAAQDGNGAVRVQAATALAKIEHDFMTRYLQSEKLLRKAPQRDPVHLKIARLYESYAQAGFIDEGTRCALRLKATTAYETYLAWHGDDEAQASLARLYMQEGQSEKGCRLLSEAVESGDATPKILSCYMEILFRLRRLEQLRAVTKRYAHALARRNSDAFALWSRTAADALTDKGHAYAVQ